MDGIDVITCSSDSDAEERIPCASKAPKKRGPCIPVQTSLNSNDDAAMPTTSAYCHDKLSSKFANHNFENDGLVAVGVVKKRKRTKDEIEMEKREKDIRRIQREATASQKSQSEKYTYCHVGPDALERVENLEVAARMLFLERNLSENFVVDPMISERIEWRKKCVDVGLNDSNSVKRVEYTCLHHTFAVVVTPDVLHAMIYSSLEDFVSTAQLNYPVANSHAIIICCGNLKVPNALLDSVAVSLFENLHAQIRVVKDVAEMALFLAQMLRGLSHVPIEGARTIDDNKLLISVEKGVKIGDRKDLVFDWWNKMLATISRMSSVQRRAVLKHIPDPTIACKQYSNMGYTRSVTELADILCENNRRLGPAMAHRIYMILTDTSGSELVE